MVEPRMLVEVYDKSSTTFYVNNTDLNKPEDLRKVFLSKSIAYQTCYNNSILDYCVASFQQEQQRGNVEYLTTKLGWQKIPGQDEPEFILRNLVVPNFPPILYAGDDLEFTKGTPKGQWKFIKDEILPYKETRLALVMGLTSVVSSYIQPYKSIGTLVVNVAGKSSTGKSTISELSASMFGDPKTSNHGLVRTFNATKTFLLEMTSGRNGLPIILDDANANPKEHSISDLIYQFDMGESRGRCNSNGSVQNKKDGWSGLVLITSESPLLDTQKVFKGALVRTLTLNNIGWTQDKDHSDRIKQGVRDNFGYIGKLFATHISKKGKDEILALQDKYEKIIISKMLKKDDLTYRMASKLAPFAITAELINEMVNKQVIDINEIIEMIVGAEQTSIKKRNKKEDFLDCLQSFISVNNKEFHKWYERRLPQGKICHDKTPAKGKVYGSIHRQSEDSYVLIDKTIFLQFLKDEGITEWNTIREQLLEEKILVRRDNEHDVWRANTDLKAPHYKFLLDIYNISKEILVEENFDEEENTEVQMPKVCEIDFNDEESINEIFGE